jgi:hypothetical protein
MSRQQATQLRLDLPVTSTRQFGVDPVFGRVHAGVGEASRFRFEDEAGLRVGQRFTPPQVEGLTQSVGSGSGIVGLAKAAGSLEEDEEPLRIDVVRSDSQPVAGRDALKQPVSIPLLQHAA